MKFQHFYVNLSIEIKNKQNKNSWVYNKDKNTTLYRES